MLYVRGLRAQRTAADPRFPLDSLRATAASYARLRSSVPASSRRWHLLSRPMEVAYVTVFRAGKRGCGADSIPRLPARRPSSSRPRPELSRPGGQRHQFLASPLSGGSGRGHRPSHQHRQLLLGELQRQVVRQRRPGGLRRTRLARPGPDLDRQRAAALDDGIRRHRLPLRRRRGRQRGGGGRGQQQLPVPRPQRQRGAARRPARGGYESRRCGAGGRRDDRHRRAAQHRPGLLRRLQREVVRGRPASGLRSARLARPRPALHRQRPAALDADPVRHAPPALRGRRGRQRPRVQRDERPVRGDMERPARAARSRGRGHHVQPPTHRGAADRGDRAPAQRRRHRLERLQHQVVPGRGRGRLRLPRTARRGPALDRQRVLLLDPDLGRNAPPALRGRRRPPGAGDE